MGSPRTAGTPAPRNPNGRTATSFAAEDGLALLQHRAATLARVLTTPRRLDERVDIVVRDRLARRERPLDEGLDAGQRERRVVGDGARELRRRGVEVRRRHDLVHHPDLARAPRLDRPAREQQVPRVRGPDDLDQLLAEREAGHERSEEHTSELQSLAYLVCRLLLEKKKNKVVYTDVNLTE